MRHLATIAVKATHVLLTAALALVVLDGVQSEIDEEAVAAPILVARDSVEVFAVADGDGDGVGAYEPSVVLPELVQDTFGYRETTAPGLSEAGFARFYVNSTSHTLQLSANGGAYGGIPVLVGSNLTIAGEFAGGDGTAGNPTYGFSSSGANDGIYWDVTNSEIRFSIDSTNKIEIDSTNTTFLSGDAAATPNVAVEAGEGMYDCGTNCIGLAAATVEVFNADATDTLIAQDDTVETITDTGSNGSFAWALDGTLRLTLQTGGHITSGATATTDAGTGTCSAVTVAGNDVRGTITATCTVGQTVIMNFGTGYVAAPICVISGADGDAVTAGAFATTSTAALTLTAGVGVAAAQIYKYVCIE